MDLELPIDLELPMDFRICLAESLHLAQGNLQGAISHPKTVDGYLKDELTRTEYMGLIQDAKSPQCRSAGLELSQSLTSRIKDTLS